MENGVAIAFWTLAVVSVGSALAVVLLQDIFRAALSLILCFVVIAGLFITLQADFLAAVQILINAGAIAIIIIFAIMLTRDVQRGNPTNRLALPALILAGLLLVMIVVISLGTSWPLAQEAPLENTTSAIATALFDKEKGWVLPFEVASVLLLAAVIGAIALARER